MVPVSGGVERVAGGQQYRQEAVMNHVAGKIIGDDPVNGSPQPGARVVVTAPAWDGKFVEPRRNQHAPEHSRRDGVEILQRLIEHGGR
jgi:hypothetical protein